MAVSRDLHEIRDSSVLTFVLSPESECNTTVKKVGHHFQEFM